MGEGARGRTPVFGVRLRLVRTEDGGRAAPLGGGAGEERRYAYRPNWGLPGMTPPDQAGAVVLGFSRADIAPGEEALAVVVPFTDDAVSTWRDVAPGVVLPCYEGVRVAAHGEVLWRREASLPFEPDELERFERWLADPSGEPPG